MDKRISCRAIIINNGKMVSMYREKGDRVYYTFPGGGKNEDESLEGCVVREVIEEFGSGVGEEFQPDRNKGIYIPMMLDLNKLSELPLMPLNVRNTLIEDLKNFGNNLADTTKKIEGTII